MRIVLTFVLNAGLNLALGLAIAALLGADDYGRFAVGSTVAVVMAMALFDWLRLATTRFYGERQRDVDPGIRATLNATYTGLGALLVAATGLAVTVHLDFSLGPALLTAAALGGLSNGLFDYYAALARSRFLDRTYAVLVILKNLLAFGIGVGASVVTRDPAVALAATSAGALLALMPVRGALADTVAHRAHASFVHLRGFAGYGFPVVAANIVFQVVILANRSMAAAAFGYADSGRLSLATDLGLRLFLAVGSAVDVFVFQLAVRADADHGRRAAEAQLRLNTIVVTAVLTLLAVGYALALPAFTAVLVPERYRADFGPLSLALLPGITLFCIAQFALNPMFQVCGRTGPVLVAALVALGIDGIGLALMPPDMGVLGIAALHSLSLGVSAAAVAGLALRTRAHRPPLGDLLRVGVAALVTALAMWPARSIAPAWLSLGIATIVGSSAYVVSLIALDVAGVRAAVAARLGVARRAKAVEIIS